MGLKITIPNDDIKAAFESAIGTAISAEKALGDEAQREIQQLVADLYPLLVAETQKLVTNPVVAQDYLDILKGIVEAAMARLGLVALATQKEQVSAAIQTALKVLAMVLKAAVVA